MSCGNKEGFLCAYIHHNLQERDNHSNLYYLFQKDQEETRMPDWRDSALRIRLMLSEHYKGGSEDIIEIPCEDNLFPRKIESD